MNQIALTTWRGRLLAAEAILAAPSAHERQTKRALADGAAALGGALDALDEALRDLESTRRLLNEERERYDALFAQIPVPTITTSRSGDILDINEAARSLLNTSARSATGRSLLLYFEDRVTWAAALRSVDEANPIPPTEVTVRPRERAPRQCQASIGACASDVLLWFFIDRL
jgi:PAS domain-containing protein